MTSPKFSIIIPNYNGAGVLTQNLPKIITLAKEYNAPIIIIDDYSKDNSIQILTEQFNFEKLTPNSSSTKILITKNQNDGFSTTVNIGVAHATTELVLLLNSDAVPFSDAIKQILPSFADPKIFSVGMKDIDDDNQTHGQGKFIFHEGFLLHNKVQNSLLSSQQFLPTGWVSCGSGFFRKSLWDQLGGLEELFNPFYFEDVDLGYRATKAGYKNLFAPSAQCTHLHNKGAIKSNYNEQRIREISIRNQFIFTWLNLTDSQLFFSHLLQLPRHILRSILTNDTIFLKGMFQALKKINNIHTHRITRYKQNHLTDQQVLNSLV